jgi:hypothetical protein
VLGVDAMIMPQGNRICVNAVAKQRTVSDAWSQQSR